MALEWPKQWLAAFVVPIQAGFIGYAALDLDLFVIGFALVLAACPLKPADIVGEFMKAFSPPMPCFSALTERSFSAPAPGICQGRFGRVEPLVKASRIRQQYPCVFRDTAIFEGVTFCLHVRVLTYASRSEPAPPARSRALRRADLIPLLPGSTTGIACAWGGNRGPAFELFPCSFGSSVSWRWEPVSASVRKGKSQWDFWARWAQPPT